jgi:hypothetical protein
MFSVPYSLRKVLMVRRLPLALLPLALVAAACAEDDGAKTREAGSVVVIGPPPPGGGGSVSAIGSGCTTKGASTKVPAASFEVHLDEHTLTVPAEVPAGVDRVVVKNFGDDPHDLVITQLDSADDLPRVDGAADVDGLPNTAFRVMEFPSNTICTATFELPAGRYVAFSNVGDDLAQGMVTTFVVG